MPSTTGGKRALSFLFSHRHARDSTSATLTASTLVPSSGIAATQNSQGASAAALELGRMLDCAFLDGQAFGDVDDDEINGEAESLSAQLKLELSRLDREAGLYANARLSEEIKSRSWSCSQPDAQLIRIAMSCAAAVYRPSKEHKIEGIQLRKLRYVKPSYDGLVKATAFTVVQDLGVLLVAVRGTANVIDHVVNFNGETAAAGDFINVGGITSSEERVEPINCHAGFLNGARALLELVKCETRKNQMPKIIFCGHSAGGAVAALLFAHFLSYANTHYPDRHFSLITFGAPPVTRPHLTTRLKSNHPNSSQRGFLLAFINEFDIVTRADRSYIRSLVNLYISSQPQTQPPSSTAIEPTGRTATSPHLQPPPQPSTLLQQRSTTWPLSSPDFYNLGDLILLKGEIITTPTSTTENTASSTATNDLTSESAPEESRLNLRAHPVSSDEFAEMLFCRLAVHSHKAYEASVDEIWMGRLGGRVGWGGEDALLDSLSGLGI